MPLFMSIAALVVDGTNLLVHRRQLQTAADAASLAAAQQINGTLNDNNCAVHVTDVQTAAECYSGNNGGPSNLHACNDPNPANPTDTNCFTWPYKGNSSLVEVRLSESVGGFITGAVDALLPGHPLGNAFNVSARSVASASPQLGTVTTPGTTVNPSTDPNTTIPGGTHTTTDPDTSLGGNGVAFLMSQNCTAMTYAGAGAKSGDPALGAFATNGGITFQGNVPKKVTSLFYNQQKCPSNPPVPPSGTSQCTSTAWGDPTESNNACVQTLVDLNQNHTLPITWPLPLPTIPTVLAAGTTWDASTMYPGKCIDTGSANIGSGWASSHPPGVYCFNGTLTLGGDLTTGDGYTFFALNGGSIQISSNGTLLKFYWPSACGARSVTNTRPASFSCFGRTLWSNSSWDPQTLLYATFSTVGTAAINLTGQNGNLTGDLFAPNPLTFPPGATQDGGLVHIGGGALTAGSGFIEAWDLDIRGNTGSYTGTGVPIVIPGGTHTTTDPSTTIFGQTHPGTTVPGSTQTVTTGTTYGLDE
jgi:Flp pilus assembly protein TadG